MAGDMVQAPLIGILTYHFSDNYGAVLQAYALKRWFEERGCKAEFINYHPLHVEAGGAVVAAIRARNWKGVSKILYLRVSSGVRKLRGPSKGRALERFRAKHLTTSSGELRSADDVQSYFDGSQRRYSLLVCGSDQIWSPSVQHGLDPVYFLSFDAGSSVRRISYAPSFGRSELAPEYHNEARRLISGLDGISVREQSGVAIIRSLTGGEAACVPDPTLLHRSYNELINDALSGRNGAHVFCYALRSAHNIRQVALGCGRQLNLPVLSPYNAHRRWREIGKTVYPSPEEWIGLISNAAFVVTNSFHGVVFSVIMKKPFIAVGLPQHKQALNERVVNLLSALDLMHRFVPNGDTQVVRALLSERIDWEGVEQRLSAMREAGLTYLESQIIAAGFNGS